MVLEVQKWLNETYSGRNGYTRITEDGRTGNTTVGALIIGLQIELGVANPVPSFGPTTERLFPGLDRQSDDEEPHNIYKILQGGFWCKGYNPGGLTGNFFATTERAVREFQEDVGIDLDGWVDAKLMKAILNTDGFRLRSPNPPYIRTMQQLLNREYSNYFDYIPTNGVYERNSNRALIYALQHEIGIGHIANGNYGPSTITNTPTLMPGNTRQRQNRILQFALAANGYYQTNLYDGIYGDAVESGVSLFQEFMTLPVTGIANMPTIKQLLTSNGFVERAASAADASTILDRHKAHTLVINGYEVIGRYLTGTVGGTRSKAMTPEELVIIEEYGLKVFPIYQDGGWYPEYFAVNGRGRQDAIKAINAADRLGFPNGTTIYFAVDYDAYDYQVTNNILPYLAEVRTVINNFTDENKNPRYELGVYGSRNTCIRAMSDSSVNAKHSFVGNMSTGFSGNLGFPMPPNWSFNQFHEMTIGTGSGAIGIDKNDYSGKDEAVSRVNPPASGEKSPEYQARFKELVRLGEKIPGFLSDPNIFNTSFAFDRSYTVLDVSFLAGSIKVDVNTSTSFTPETGDGLISLEVNNGMINMSTRDMLGDLYGQLSVERIDFVENTIDDLKATVGNGWITFTSNFTATTHTMAITAFRDNIDVDGGGTVELAVSVVYTIETNLLPPDYELIRNASVIGIAFGGAFAVAKLILRGFPVIGPITTIVSFLLGLIDEFTEDE